MANEIEAILLDVVFPETCEVVLELFRRGYRLGLVNNTVGSLEAPELLRQMKMVGCFETVVHSPVVGKRMPDPSILLQAAQRMGTAPEKCAYVGDRMAHGVAAARNAGFSKTVILRSDVETDQPKSDEVGFLPEAVVEDHRDLLKMFLPRPAPQPAVVYDASLSTMYAMNNFPSLVDFFEFGRRVGFARIELNHKVTSAMLEGINLESYSISSVHEPCPADIGEDALKKRDWLISSLDEDCRVAGVRAIMRSIDIAGRVGAGTVVIHAGQVAPDADHLEKQLRELALAGLSESAAFRAINARMRDIRAKHVGAGFASVKKSIRELLEYAGPLGTCLGIENRYHYLEYPNPDELGRLLQLAGPDRIGFIFDIGHAETLDRLGFYPKATWLQRFGDRIVGTHLHDIVSTTDHYAPGLGSADFQTAAAFLPEQAFRTCELQTFNSPEQVKAGLEYLAQQGCIRKL